ncbi:MAG: hypothetical protein WC522_02240 [Candidatus Omnitrophota bacterium]
MERRIQVICALIFSTLIFMGLCGIAFANGTISGSVTRSSDGQVIFGIHVYADPITGGNSIVTQTNDAGGFNLSLPAGSYRIRSGGEIIAEISYVQEYYDEQTGWGTANMVTVSDGQTLYDVNFTLDIGGVISGVVYKEDGVTPLADEYIGARSTDGAKFAGTRTGSSGAYIMAAPAGEFKVRAGGNTEYAPKWYAQKNSFYDADTVTVLQGETAANIDFTLDVGATVAGVVYDNLGAPKGSVTVIYNDYALSRIYPYSRSAVTDPNGTFILQGLAGGICKISAEPIVNSGLAFSGKYIYLNPGENKVGMDFSLSQGYRIWGYVKNAKGAGLYNVRVKAGTADEPTVAEAVTDLNGQYEMALAPSIYSLRISDDCGSVALPKIKTVSGQAKVQDFIAYDNSNAETLEGVVTNSGSGVTSSFMLSAYKAGVAANISPFNYGLYANGCFSENLIAEGGEFNIFVAPRSSYDLCFLAINIASRGMVSCTVRDIRYKCASNSEGNGFNYDFTGGEVAGKVTYDHKPLLMAKVFLLDSSELIAGVAETDENGTYNIYNVAPGDYILEAKTLDGEVSQMISAAVVDEESTAANLKFESASQIITADLDGNGKDEIIINFGTQYGIWIYYNNSTWAKLHDLSPESVTAGDLDASGKDDIIIDFGPQYGIWIYYNNETWRQLHTISPKSMITSDLDGNGKAEIIVDFGSQYGIWIYYNNETWQKLHDLNAKFMTVGDTDGDGVKDDIIVDFGNPYGIWIYYSNDEIWEHLHSVSSDSIVVKDINYDGVDDIIVDFGRPYGIWIYYDCYFWDHLHDLSPETMAVNSFGDVMIDFGPQYGMWAYYAHGDYANNWFHLAGATPQSISVGNIDGDEDGWDDIIIDFGSGYGVWVYYNDSIWVQLHYLSP